MIKSVIDIGSNTIKLFIGEIDNNNKVKPLVIKRRMTRLGKNISKNGTLSKEAKELVLKHLEEYLKIIKIYDISKNNILVTATAACRNSSDGKEFIAYIKEQFKLPNIKILSGKEEAQYTFLGVLESIPSSNYNDIYIVLDVGGGSFQLSYGNKTKYLGGISIQKGCNSVTEEFKLNQKVSGEELNKAISFFKQLNLEGIPRNSSGLKLIGTGGTVKIIQLMIREQDDFTPIKLKELYNIAEFLANKNTNGRFNWFKNKYQDETFRIDTGLTINRAEVLLAGICILIGIMENLLADRIFLSSTDAKDYIIRLSKI